MSEPQTNQPINLSSFAEWCKHKDSLSESAIYTVEVLLNKAGTSDCNEADRILSNLTELNLNWNKITDITPLSALTNLTYLNLNYNQITDITGLSALTNLTYLSLSANPITDITGLSALTNLTYLDLSANQITDITGLSALTNLTDLNLFGNQITDITGLSALTNLTYLNLYQNQITDITGLSALTNLTDLALGHNQIIDITGLSGLTNLTDLDLEMNQIIDITGLSGLTNLTKLELYCNEIIDIIPLSTLTNLTILSLSQNQITDITGLSGLTNLTILRLCGNQITDITPLSGLTNLTDLDLQCNQITDITGLLGLTNLTILRLCGNQITDIAGLSGLTNLTDLNLQCNPITDITGLLGLTNLTILPLYNPITDLNLSLELTQKYLTLSTTPIDAKKATETVKNIYVAIGHKAPQVIICSSPPVADLNFLKQLKIDSRSPNQISQKATGNLGWGKSLLKELFQSVDVGVSLMFWKELGDEIILEPDTDCTLVSELEELAINYPESRKSESRLYSNYLQPLTPTDLVKEIHLTEFFISKLGITLDQKAQEILRCKQQLFEDCGWIFPFENICLVCDRPLHLRFDSANELHAEGESAIAFADGYSLYFHHGVKLPEKYGKVHPDLWQAEWLLSESNAELRRVLIETIGYDRICQQLQAVELDSWQEYTLLKIDNADLEPIYLLKMTCPSTGFIHALRVPPDLESAQEAIRWVNWGINPEEFSVQT
ncbi:leucine-rich repeat domain-containing protein [Microcoleus sp. C2C3]